MIGDQLSDPTVVVIVAAAFFVFLVLVALARAVLRRDPGYRRWRVGIFVERDRGDDERDEV